MSKLEYLPTEARPGTSPNGIRTSRGSRFSEHIVQEHSQPTDSGNLRLLRGGGFTTEEKRNVATDLARRGLRIFPWRPVDGEKRPHIEDWPSRATNDAAQVAEWWECWPDANVGIATGPQPCGINLFVLDTDVKGGKPGNESLQFLLDEHGALPHTPRIETPTGGNHRYFTYPNGITVRSLDGFTPFRRINKGKYWLTPNIAYVGIALRHVRIP